MAILPGIPGIEVSVSIEGQQAAEYPTSGKPEHLGTRGLSSSVSKLIECKAGEQFTINLKVSDRYEWGLKSHGLNLAAFVDGEWVKGELCREHSTRHAPWERTISYRIVKSPSSPSGFASQSFRFLNLRYVNNATDRRARQDRDRAKYLGSIEVKVYRMVESSGRTTYSPPYDRQERLTLATQSIEGKPPSHVTWFTEPQPVTQPKYLKCHTLQEDKGPIGVYRFLYRSRGYLSCEGVLPRAQDSRSSNALALGASRNQRFTGTHQRNSGPVNANLQRDRGGNGPDRNAIIPKPPNGMERRQKANGEDDAMNIIEYQVPPPSELALQQTKTSKTMSSRSKKKIETIIIDDDEEDDIPMSPTKANLEEVNRQIELLGANQITITDDDSGEEVKPLKRQGPSAPKNKEVILIEDDQEPRSSTKLRANPNSFISSQKGKTKEVVGSEQEPNCPTTPKATFQYRGREKAIVLDDDDDDDDDDDVQLQTGSSRLGQPSKANKVETQPFARSHPAIVQKAIRWAMPFLRADKHIAFLNSLEGHKPDNCQSTKSSTSPDTSFVQKLKPDISRPSMQTLPVGAENRVSIDTDTALMIDSMAKEWDAANQEERSEIPLQQEQGTSTSKKSHLCPAADGQDSSQLPSSPQQHVESATKASKAPELVVNFQHINHELDKLLGDAKKIRESLRVKEKGQLVQEVKPKALGRPVLASIEADQTHGSQHDIASACSKIHSLGSHKRVAEKTTVARPRKMRKLGPATAGQDVYEISDSDDE
ncbi:hypothetical protein F4780DRAFT_669012 [Xylariomycetidae sp. FL0641]|nr:hypothetical protein F4780DRAFT_669012 [Xylariomycetidae sp. FL0641]